MTAPVSMFTDEELKVLFTITLHFDVRDAQGAAKHSIPIEQFIVTAKAVQMIVDDLNRAYFDNKLPIKLHMPAFEEGGVIIDIINDIINWLEAHPVTAGIVGVPIIGIVGFFLLPLGENVRNKIYDPKALKNIELLLQNEDSKVSSKQAVAILMLGASFFIMLPNEDLIK